MKTRISLLLIVLIIANYSVNALELNKSDKRYRRVQKYKMNWKGYQRIYLVHLPQNIKTQSALPILFHLHGGGGTARSSIGLTYGRFNELSNRDGFIVVYPQAVAKNWNDGRKSNKVKAWRENIDDVGFIVAIIEELNKKYSIDNNRIFTTGMSNGGFMSSRLICDRADIFRGAAILTATLSVDYFPKCKPEQSTAVMVMNGTEDKIVPFNGGQVKVLNKSRGNVLSTGDIMKFWKEKNECITKKPMVSLSNKQNDGTTVDVIEYENCNERGSLILYRINGGGHTWPGGKQYFGERLIGKTSRDIVACDIIWNYFKSL